MEKTESKIVSRGKFNLNKNTDWVLDMCFKFKEKERRLREEQFDDEEDNMIIFSSCARNFPIRNKWILWFWNGSDDQVKWIDLLKEVGSFNTVVDFWRLYNNLKTPSAITPPSDYSVFKEGIMPIWEDKQNIDGGRWLMIFPRIGGVNSIKCHEDLDRVWLELLLCLIGEGFGSDSDVICGGYINLRKGCDKMSLWIGKASDEAIDRIGDVIKSRTGFDGRIRYESHCTTKCKLERTGKHTEKNYIY